MHTKTKTDRKCERCGADVESNYAFDDYGPAAWESCSRLCYHWFDYGMAHYKPEGISDFRDLTGVLGKAAPEAERLAEMEARHVRTGIVDPELAQKSFSHIWLNSLDASFGTCNDCGAVVENENYIKHYAWHRGRTVE